MAATASSSSGSTAEIEYPPASDGEALQLVFSQHCNDEGLMSEKDMRNVPAIKDMLEQGDLLSSELIEIWKAAPKFPQGLSPGEDDKIDVDSFIQVYRDIDDLFEEDEDGEEKAEESTEEVVVEASDSEAENDEDELKQTFATISQDDKISFSQLRKWEDIALLIEDEGTLGEDEYMTLWKDTLSVEGTDGDMNIEEFIKFNTALDELFEFEDEEPEDDEEEGDEDISLAEEPAPAPAAPLPIITEEDLPAGVLFSQLANENYLVSNNDLQRWGELNEMIKEGDMTTDELDTLFKAVEKAPGTKDMLDEDGFCALYDAIDNLFEGDDDDSDEDIKPAVKELKDELLEYIEDIAKLAEEEGQQPCGLDCSELEQERVLEIVSELEREPYNQVTVVSASGGGAVEKEELVGTWELLYSSSSTMKYNEGLSGLAGGLTRFGGLRQDLSATKYLSDVEYMEEVIGKLGGKSFDVKITGDWDMRTEVSLFTGKPSNVLSVTPDKVAYGPRSDKADHWKSLGPMNLLVLSYLDSDLRIMRGNTSTDTLFIWKRIR